MVMIDRQRRRSRKPEKFAALDLDSGRKRHVDGLVIVRVVDDFHVRIRRRVRRLSLYGRERRKAESEDGEAKREAKRWCVVDHGFLQMLAEGLQPPQAIETASNVHLL